jgi:two-component system C4-dicarboxylate transport response regulator DctD
VRELRNAADRYVLGLGLDDDTPLRAEGGLAEQVNAFEKTAIAAALVANRGNLKPTYEALGLSRKTLYEKMHKHGLRREDFTET